MYFWSNTFICILHNLACVISKPLTFLINLALKNNTFPTVLKRFKEIPVFYRGTNNKIDNYRPITINYQHISGIWNIIIHGSIFSHIQNVIITQIYLSVNINDFSIQFFHRSRLFLSVVFKSMDFFVLWNIMSIPLAPIFSTYT